MADSGPNDERRRNLADDMRRNIEDDVRRRFEAQMERRRQRWEERWARRQHHSGSGGVVIGVVLAAIGVLLLLQNLGILFIDDLWMYWPVILIVLGASRLATAFTYGSRLWGAIVAFAGVIFLLDNLGLIRGNAWNYIWPILLITVGVGLLARGLDRGGRFDWWNPMSPSGNPDAAGNAGAAGPPGSVGSSVSGRSFRNALSEWAFFSGIRRRVESQEFEGGDLLAMFGGIRVDMDRAGTKKDEIRIEANAVFGGIDIRLPDTWTVTVHGTGIFGGYEDKTVDPRNTEGKPPHVIITGIALFGGVTVKN